MLKILKENNGWYCAADAGEGDPPPPPATIEIELEGGEKKSFNAEDIVNLVKQGASATQKTQEVKEIVDAAAKYNLNPMEYIQQTEGAFAVISKLVDSKIIDDQGNVIAPKKKDEPPAGDLLPAKPLVGEERTNAIVADALKSVVDPLKEGMKVLQEDNTKLIRAQLEMQVQGKHPTLSRDDVSDLLVVASQDGKKNLMEHAQEMVEQKKVGKASTRAEYAKEFGVNLEEFDANKLREDDPGGGAAALFKGKKFSFDTRGRHRKDDNVVTPKTASHGFVQASQKG